MRTMPLLLVLGLVLCTGCDHSDEPFSWDSLAGTSGSTEDRLRLADELFILQVRLDELWAARAVPYVRRAVTDEALRRMAENLGLASDRLRRAASTSSVDPDLVRAARMGRVLGGFAHDLVSMQIGASRGSERLGARVMGEVNGGLAWVWEGMDALREDSGWAATRPKHAYQVLYWAQTHRDNVRRVLPAAYVTRKGLEAALIVSTAMTAANLVRAGLPALARVIAWMRGLGQTSGALALAGAGGSGVQLLTDGGGLVLTDAEVIALAEAGQISAAALSLYVLAHEAHVHHVATDKNYVSDRYGGPWSQRFSQIFEEADLSFDDPANLVEVEGHTGPHPEAYHKVVFDDIVRAVKGLKPHTVEYRNALRAVLRKLGRECATEGTRLNLLLRRVVTE